MAAPVLQATGAIAATAFGSNIAPTLPTHQVDDILVASVLVWVPNATVSTTLATPSGWTRGNGEILFDGSANFEGEWAWFWRRAVSAAETAPTFDRGTNWGNGSSTCMATVAYVIRGCVTTGDPWDASVKSALRTTANQAMAAVTVSGSERLVIQFVVKADDNGAVTAATGWTIDTAVLTSIGSDALLQVLRKDNVSSSTSADSTTIAAAAQGGYVFFGVSFKPPGGGGTTGSSATTLVRHVGAGSGSTTLPPTTGSGSPSLARVAGAGAGSTNVAPVTGSSATTLVRHSGVGSGTATAPGTSGSGSPSLARVTGAGAGSTGATGSGSPLLVRVSGAGTGSTNVAAVTGSGSPSLTRVSGAGSGSVSSGATVPAAVVDLDGVAADSQVVLTWTAPADGGAAITDYVVQFREA